MRALLPDHQRSRVDGRTEPGCAQASGLDEDVAPAPPGAANALPRGTRLDEFEITGVLEAGRFSIVYCAYDHALERQVAIKEYLPSDLAGRAHQPQVSIKSPRHAESFQAGMRSFINEARFLARFDHPALVKVYRFWEGNGTAYMALPNYQGKTLTRALREMGRAPDEAWLRALLAPLLDALEAIHSEHCFHRAIVPDNILLLAGDRPLLLESGSARRTIVDMVQNCTVILEPGYAPIEQYAEVASIQQGPWTDIYALASVVYFAIAGRPPAPSVARLINDAQEPLARSSAAGRYSGAFLAAIDQALAVRPEHRPQSIAELRTLIDLPGATARQAPPAQPPAAPRKAPLRYTVGAAVLVVVAGAAVYLFGRGPPQPAPRPPVPIDVLGQIMQASNRNHAVTVSVAQPLVRIGKDRPRFAVHSSKAGYLYVLMVGTDRSQFWLLFPNEMDRDNRINAGGTLELPRPNWRMNATGPPGSNHLLAIVSDAPRDFSAAGLKASPPFAEFPMAALEKAASNVDGSPVFAGTPRCAPSVGAACPTSFGAALFSIEETLAQ